MGREKIRDYIESLTVANIALAATPGTVSFLQLKGTDLYNLSKNNKLSYPLVAIEEAAYTRGGNTDSDHKLANFALHIVFAVTKSNQTPTNINAAIDAAEVLGEDILGKMQEDFLNDSPAYPFTNFDAQNISADPIDISLYDGGFGMRYQFSECQLKNSQIKYNPSKWQ